MVGGGEGPTTVSRFRKRKFESDQLQEEDERRAWRIAVKGAESGGDT